MVVRVLRAIPSPSGPVQRYLYSYDYYLIITIIIHALRVRTTIMTMMIRMIIVIMIISIVIFIHAMTFNYDCG